MLFMYEYAGHADSDMPAPTPPLLPNPTPFPLPIGEWASVMRGMWVLLQCVEGGLGCIYTCAF